MVKFNGMSSPKLQEANELILSMLKIKSKTYIMDNYLSISMGMPMVDFIKFESVLKTKGYDPNKNQSIQSFLIKKYGNAINSKLTPYITGQ